MPCWQVRTESTLIVDHKTCDAGGRGRPAPFRLLLMLFGEREIANRYSVRCPDGLIVGSVDDNIAVILNDKMAPGRPGVQRPYRVATGNVDHEVPVTLQVAHPGEPARRVRRPDRYPAVVEHQVAVALVAEAVAASGGDDLSAGLRT